MLNSVMLDNIMQRFGNRRSPALRTTTLYELNRKIAQLEQGDVIPWFLEQRWLSTSTPPAVTVANQDFVILPPRFLREIEEGEFKILSSSGKWIKLLKVSLERLEEETENETPAMPEGYAIFGNTMRLGPTPDAVYNLKLPYYEASLEIEDNNTEASNGWIINFYNFITLDTIDFVARTHLQAEEVVQRISGDLQQATDLFWRAVEARQHVNRDYLLDNSES